MDWIALVLSLGFWAFGCWLVPHLIKRAEQRGRDKGIQEGYNKCLLAQQARQQSQQ